MANAIAQTILQQLGGNKFVVMTGAKNLLAHNDGLSFRLPRNASGANYIKITLTAGDDYTVEALKLGRSIVSEQKAYREGVYCDNLQAVFTSLTGLYTSLGTLGK